MTGPIDHDEDIGSPNDEIISDAQSGELISAPVALDGKDDDEGGANDIQAELTYSN